MAPGRPRGSLPGESGPGPVAILAGVESLGRVLVLAGLLLLIVGLALSFGPKVPWLGRLPGDLRIERPGLRIYLPITTCLLLSAVVSLVLWVLGRLR